MLEYLPLDLEARHVLAASAHCILQPVDENVLAGRLLPNSVARMEPQVAPCGYRRFGHVMVAVHDRPWIARADDDFPGDARRNVQIVFVDDPRLEIRTQPTRAAGRRCSRRRPRN